MLTSTCDCPSAGSSPTTRHWTVAPEVWWLSGRLFSAVYEQLCPGLHLRAASCVSF